MNSNDINQENHRRLWGRIALRVFIILVILSSCVFLLPPFVKTCFPFVAGFIVAWMLHPLIEGIRKKIKISRKILSFIFTISLVFIAGGIIALFFYSLISQVVSLVSNWLEAGGDLSGLLSSGNPLSELLAQLPENMGSAVQDLLTQFSGWLKENLSSLLSTMTTSAGNFIVSIPSFFVSLLVFISATYFISTDYPAIRSSFTGRFQGGLRKFLGFVRNTTTKAFGAYLKSQLLISLGVFFIILFGFLIIGQKYALLLAFIFAVLDFIPIIGAGTVMVPWAVIALLTGNYALAIKLMAIWLIVAFFRKILEPKVVGSQTGLSPLLSLMSIYLGMRVAGITGMVLGPIFFQVILAICKSSVFDGLIEDLKLLVNQGVAYLKNRPESDVEVHSENEE